MIAEVRVGPVIAIDGTTATARASRDGSVVAQDSHARYQEAVYRGNVYTISTAAAGVALAAANASLVAATAQPVVGFINPAGSGKNCVVLYTTYVIQATGASAANAGIPVYQVAAPGASTSITGTVPINNLTLQAKGSVVVGSLNQAFTGNTATFVQLRPFVLPVSLTAAPTASINVNVGGLEEVAGSIIVPPGAAFGIFVLAAGTTITVGASITWEEIPI